MLTRQPWPDHEQGQGVHVSGLQLLDLAVFQDQVHYGMHSAEFLQNCCPSGHLAGLSASQPSPKLQLVEEHGRQLSRGIDVKLMADMAVYLLLQVGDLYMQLAAERFQVLDVDRDTSLLHAGQHFDEGQLHFSEEALKALRHEFLLQHGHQPAHRF